MFLIVNQITRELSDAKRSRAWLAREIGMDSAGLYRRLKRGDDAFNMTDFHNIAAALGYDGPRPGLNLINQATQTTPSAA